jgi:putative Ca2+/H+ antiporter (TMEM165/GDT1 family)
LSAFFSSLILVSLAEMGDKTQLMVMAFATRYKAWQVLTAISLAIICLQGLAVIAGRMLAAVIPFQIISFIAAISFIVFGIITLLPEKEENHSPTPSAHAGIILSIALTFFAAEMGDKTQLATVSLAIEHQNTLGVMVGSTVGMLIGDSVGLLAGLALHKHLPERTIKLASAGAFIIFGILGIIKSTGGM